MATRMVWIGWITVVVLTAAAAGAERPAVETAVPYVENGHPEQVLDLYWPPVAPRAAVLFVHGGSLLESGERRFSPVYADVCPRLAERGLACATVDYRLHPSVRWPAMPEDVASAVAKTRELLRQRGAEPRNLFLFGHSSGCQLVATLSANPVYLAAHGLSPEDLAGVMPMGCTLDPYDAQARGATEEMVEEMLARDSWDRGLYGTADQWLASNPSFHLGPHVPPTLVVVAREERFFPPILEQGARYVRRLLELERDADLLVVPGRHMSSIQDFGAPGDPTIEALLGFVDRHGVGRPPEP